MLYARDWLLLLAAVGNLSLAAIAIVAGQKSALARPLAALCFSLFGFNFATLAHHELGADAFDALDSMFTAISPAPLFDFVLTFVGQKRRFRAARAATWLAFGALALVSLTGVVSKPMLAWSDGNTWAICFLVGWVPSLLFEVVLLVRHLARTQETRERARTRIVLAAYAAGAAFATSDVAVRAFNVPVPYLASVGTFAAAALLTTLVVRHELFDRNVPLRTATYAVALIGVSVALYLLAFRTFAGSVAAQAFAAALVTLLVATVARELAIGRAESRERTQRLTVLGRFSAQMAHDIKGPLTALLGGIQVLEDEKDEVARKDLLALVADQAKRVTAIVERYDRMGRIEPRKTILRVNEIVKSVARTAGVPEDRMKLDPADPECDADRDLVESAVENVVRNAVEATKERGEVRVETEKQSGAVLVRVKDTGAGMDARQLERAFEDFFTTKATGSGLGLAFTRRVMLAHGGDVSLASEPGVGTTVELRLPC
ncbi:MAG TPA: ATP-binding protein [Labilithrix sp.]|jgi:signal transduction histidine kinase